MILCLFNMDASTLLATMFRITILGGVFLRAQGLAQLLTAGKQERFCHVVGTENPQSPDMVATDTSISVSTTPRQEEVHTFRLIIILR